MTAPGAALASVRWTAAGNLLRTIIATVQLLVIARLVAVTEFGLIVLVTSLLLLAQQLSDAGLSSALIRFRDVTEGEKSSLYWLNVAIGAGMAAATLAAAPALARAFDAPLLAGMLRIAGIVFVAQGCYLQLRVLAERELRFGAVVRLEVAATALGFVVAVGLALSGYGAFSVVWGQVASAAAQLALGWLVLGKAWRPRAHFRLAEVRRFLGYGTDMLLVNAATALTVQLDVLIAGLYFPKPVFGSFAQPRDLSLKVMTAINPVVTRVGLPLIARHQDDARAAGVVYLRVVRMSASVCFPVYAAMALLAADVLPAVLGRQWTAAAALMPPIALWFAIRCIVNPLGSYLYAMGRSRLALVYQIGFATCVALAAFAGSRAGPAALALAMAATYLVFVELCWAAVLRPISGVTFAAYHRAIAAPAAATLAATGGAWGTRAALGGGPGALALGLMAGALVFAGASLALNRAGVDEVLALLGRRRPAC